MANKKIAIVGAGAVGCYAGAHMVQAGEDVTFIDPWPEHVEAMRGSGISERGATPEDPDMSGIATSSTTKTMR